MLQILSAFRTLAGRARQAIIFLLALLLFLPYLSRYYWLYRHIRRLHVGCGKIRLDGWVNADVVPGAQLIIDLRWPLPFPANYLERIYSEHVLEHVTYETAVRFLREARRVLKPGGVIRIAMPDLDDLIEGYCQNWRRFDWVQWPEHSFIKTRAQMINIAFRWWDHQHLYNREELARALGDAGFDEFQFVNFGASEYDDLRGLESRLDSMLIAEAVKR
jgi:predicted SAM-dependent methyltransferase